MPAFSATSLRDHARRSGCGAGARSGRTAAVAERLGSRDHSAEDDRTLKRGCLMFNKLLTFSLVVPAGLALAFPAAAQSGYQLCRPGQAYNPATYSCEDKGQAQSGSHERCAPGQSLDPARKRCVATAAPAPPSRASAPPASAPSASAPSASAPSASAPSASAPAASAPAVSAPPASAPSASAPTAPAQPPNPPPGPIPSASAASPAPPPAKPNAASPATCPPDQQFDSRLQSCVPSVSAGAPATPRMIPGDPLRH
jgi:hypothetical protein